MTTKAYSLQQLRSIAEDCARPIVSDLLAQEVASMAASDLLGEARQALMSILPKEDSVLLGNLVGCDDEDSVAQLKAELIDALKEPLDTPSAEEIQSQTREVGVVMTSAWIETIRRALKAEGVEQLSLDPAVMIPRKNDIGDYLHNKLMATLGPLVVSRDEAPEIMSRLKERLFENADRVELPAHVVISQQVDGGLVATIEPT